MAEADEPAENFRDHLEDLADGDDAFGDDLLSLIGESGSGTAEDLAAEFEGVVRTLTECAQALRAGDWSKLSALATRLGRQHDHLDDAACAASTYEIAPSSVQRALARRDPGPVIAATYEALGLTKKTATI